MAEIIVAAVVALLVIITVLRSVRIIPQARARNVERFGRYRKTLEPGMNFIIPGIDRVKKEIDLREQVVSFKGAPVITEDNLVVLIDTVLFFQVTDPRAADYEIVDYIQAIEQITATMLRSVIGSMDLEKTLTSRDHINNMLRGVLDDASGKWGIRVTRVEIKAIDPPKSVKDAMEKQMRAEREKRAAILTAEGVRAVQDPHRGRREAERHPDRGRCQAGQDPAPPKARRRPSRRSSRPCTTTTPIPSCSPTSTCRRCRSSRRARATRSGSSRARSRRRCGRWRAPSAAGTRHRPRAPPRPSPGRPRGPKTTEPKIAARREPPAVPAGRTAAEDTPALDPAPAARCRRGHRRRLGRCPERHAGGRHARDEFRRSAGRDRTARHRG